MGLYSIVADTNDDAIRSQGADSAATIAGTGTLSLLGVTATSLHSGWLSSVDLRLVFNQYDVSSVAGTPKCGWMRLTRVSGGGSGIGTPRLYAGVSDFGAAVDTGDWLTDTALGSIDKLARMHTAKLPASYEFMMSYTDGGVAMASAVAAGSTLKLAIWEAQHETGYSADAYNRIETANATTSYRRPYLLVSDDSGNAPYISYKGEYQTSAGSPIDISIPATAAGEKAVVLIAGSASTGDSYQTSTTGWTREVTSDSSSPAGSIACFVRNGPAASHTLTVTHADTIGLTNHYMVLVLGRCGEVNISGTASGTDGTPDAPSVTTTADDCLVFHWAGMFDNSATLLYSDLTSGRVPIAGGGMDNAAQSAVGGMASVQSSAGSTGSETWTATAGAGAWHALTVAFAPSVPRFMNSRLASNQDPLLPLVSEYQLLTGRMI